MIEFYYKGIYKRLHEYKKESMLFKAVIFRIIFEGTLRKFQAEK